MYVCVQVEFPHENRWKNILVSVQHTCLEWAGTLNPKPYALSPKPFVLLGPKPIYVSSGPIQVCSLYVCVEINAQKHENIRLCFYFHFLYICCIMYASAMSALRVLLPAPKTFPFFLEQSYFKHAPKPFSHFHKNIPSLFFHQQEASGTHLRRFRAAFSRSSGSSRASSSLPPTPPTSPGMFVFSKQIVFQKKEAVVDSLRFCARNPES